MKNFRDLRVWNRSIDLVEKVYRFSDTFPARERFGLAAQIRSAGVSIPSNIAEGQGRVTRGEWLQFLGQARGSLYEVETHLVIAQRLGFGESRLNESAADCLADVASGLAGLMNYVRSDAKRRKD